MKVNEKYHIALFQKHLKGLSNNGGGIERVQINLSKAFIDRGYKVDLIVCDNTSLNLTDLSDKLNIINLKPSNKFISSFYSFLADPGYLWLKTIKLLFSNLRPRALQYLPAFASYLKANKPDIVFSASTDNNLVALLAKRIVNIPIHNVVSEHIVWTLENLENKKTHAKKKWIFPHSKLSKFYSEARGIVAVSDGVAKNISSEINLDKKKISVIYNPIVSTDLTCLSNKAVNHPWLIEKKYPVVLGVGRLVSQKNFSLLIKAFAKVKKYRKSKLIILGDGRERYNLQLLIKEYDLLDHIDLFGFVDNPYAFMSKVDVFVLSSIYEGLGNVLIEALACGCPVVSTDCPSGPAEILEYGKYGPLVPMNDEKALAEAIISVLDNPPPSTWLKERSMDFSVDNVAESYLQLAVGEK